MSLAKYLVQWNILVYAAMEKNEDLYIRTGKDLQAVPSGAKQGVMHSLPGMFHLGWKKRLMQTHQAKPRLVAPLRELLWQRPLNILQSTLNKELPSPKCHGAEGEKPWSGV